MNPSHKCSLRSNEAASAGVAAATATGTAATATGTAAGPAAAGPASGSGACTSALPTAPKSPSSSSFSLTSSTSLSLLLASLASRFYLCIEVIVKNIDKFTTNGMVFNICHFCMWRQSFAKLGQPRSLQRSAS